MINSVIHGDCLEEMKNIPTGSIDMILCDLPYSVTAAKWDVLIPFKPLWEQYERIIKDNGAIVLFGSQPFTSKLIMSNTKLFRYEIIWTKTMATLFQHANKRPMLKHENILVFYKKQPIYNPQFSAGEPYQRKAGSGNRKTSAFHNNEVTKAAINNTGKRYPTTIIEFSNGNHKRLHPTEKNLSLCEYLIKTYTNPGQTILDNCAGSGTAAVAAMNTGRNYILIEKEKEYIDIINKRIAEHKGVATQ